MHKRNYSLNHLDSSYQIKIGVILSYFTIGLNIISGLIYTPWMVSEIGQSEYGLYMLAVSTISFFAMDFGLGPAVSRFLSNFKAENDEEGAKKFLGITFKLFIGISIVIFFVLTIIYLLIENIYVELTPLEIEKLKIVFMISALFTVITFPFKPFDGILIANERFVYIKLLELLHKGFNVILIVITLLLGRGLYAIVLINVFTGILKVMFQFFYIKRHTETHIDFMHADRKLLKEVAQFSIWTTIISVAQRMLINVTPSILAALSGANQIAVFSIGNTIEGYTWTFSLALGGMFIPKVTMILKNDNSINELENLLIKVGRIQLLVVGLIISGFISLGQEFMLLWMGESFWSSYYVALLLILPGIVTLTQEIAYSALVALNEIRWRAFASIITTVISFCLSLILSKIYGAIGAAVSIFIGNIIGSVIIMNIIYHKVIKIDILKFFKECHFRMISPIILTIIGGTLIQRNFPTTSLIQFSLKAFVLMILYVILMWIFSLNEFEKKLFLGIFGKKL